MGVQIVLNGEVVEVDGNTSLLDLVIERAGYLKDRARVDGCENERPVGVAVALNAEIVPRSRWADTTLRPGDKVEILAASQGG